MVVKQETNPAEVFRRFGLESVGFLRSIAVPPRGDGSGPGKKLSDSFEQLGGLYLAFAEFLMWRADLLGVDYLTALRRNHHTIPPVPRDTVAAASSLAASSLNWATLRSWLDLVIATSISRVACVVSLMTC